MILTTSKLRDRIKVEKASTADDGGGGTTQTWTDHGQVRAHIERVKSIGKEVERLQGGGLIAQPVMRVHVRKTARIGQVTSGDRFLVAETGETLEVQSVQPAESSRRFLIFTCISTVAS